MLRDSLTHTHTQSRVSEEKIPPRHNKTQAWRLSLPVIADHRALCDTPVGPIVPGNGGKLSYMATVGHGSEIFQFVTHQTGQTVGRHYKLTPKPTAPPHRAMREQRLTGYCNPMRGTPACRPGNDDGGITWVLYYFYLPARCAHTNPSSGKKR